MKLSRESVEAIVALKVASVKGGTLTGLK